MGDVLKIEAHGVIDRYSYIINFSDIQDNLKALYAENGHGKTNLLKAIRYMSIADSESIGQLLMAPVQSIEIESKKGIVKYIREDHYNAVFKIINNTESESKSHKFNVSISDFRTAPGEDNEFIIINNDIKNRYTELKEMVDDIIGNIELLGTDRLYLSEEEHQFRKFYRYKMARQRQNIIYNQISMKDSGFNSGITVETSLDSLGELYEKDIRDKSTLSRGDQGVYANFTRNILQKTSVSNNSRNLIFNSARDAREAIDKYIHEINGSDELIRKYNLIDFKEYDSVQNLISSASPVNKSEFKYVAPFLLPYLENLSERMSEILPTAEKINIFVEAINTLLGDIRISYSLNAGFKLHKLKSSGREELGSEIDPGLLSSGEKHIILLLANVALASSQNSMMLMIDEPEISLGIQWQKVLVKYIRDLTRESDFQVILATHSPIILEDYMDEDIIVSHESEELV
ncbi:hypothetical protein HMPREF2625_08940 [Rothia sp. HMSC064D08]|uniref:AAA family ATPase n=1 Tax=Rothia sp. HMSC064D08 TaxID=1715104 RepID=UPI0008A5A961|nr:AAA family ATPase [Rothia sp. HMSC064D08]OFN04311.1 hypothetical protein HMPREF2625_08940 [Rothia sp. HMSC064D08]